MKSRRRPFSKSIRDHILVLFVQLRASKQNFELLGATESSFEPDIIAATRVNTNICTRQNCTRVGSVELDACVDAILDSTTTPLYTPTIIYRKF